MMTIAAATAALVIVVARPADACRWCAANPDAPGCTLQPASGPPTLLDGHLIPPHLEGGAWREAELILRLDPMTVDASSGYAIERVAGDAPFALEQAWRGVHHPTADGILAIPLDQAPVVPAFGVAVRARDVAGRDSNLIWVDHVPFAAMAGEVPRHGDGSQRAIFFGFAVALGLLAAGFRAARDPDTRVRLAVVVALAGAVLLLATAGVPWLHSLTASVDCLLGSESVCAAPPLAALDDHASGLALFELERWRASAAAIRMGQLMVFALLLPALIWLLVEPRTRPAQATCVVGASVAGFTFLAIAFFRATMPSWLVAEPYVAFDLGLLGSGAIVAAAIAIVRQSFALHGPAAPPRALARSTAAGATRP